MCPYKGLDVGGVRELLGLGLKSSLECCETGITESLGVDLAIVTPDIYLQ
jgi:hypothetical protein